MDRILAADPKLPSSIKSEPRKTTNRNKMSAPSDQNSQKRAKSQGQKSVKVPDSDDLSAVKPGPIHLTPHTTNATDFENEVKDKFRVALRDLQKVGIRHVVLKHRPDTLSTIEQAQINKFWAVRGLLKTDKNGPDTQAEFYQQLHFQADFGFVLLRGKPDPENIPQPEGKDAEKLEAKDEEEPEAAEFKIGDFLLAFKPPCVVFVEITLSNEQAILRRKIIQVIKNRVIFGFFPFHFVETDSSLIGDSEPLPLSAYGSDFRKYLVVVSDLEFETGISNFNLAYFELTQQPEFLNCLKKLSTNASLSLEAKASKEVEQRLEERESNMCLVAHISLLSRNAQNVEQLGRQVRHLEGRFELFHNEVREARTNLENEQLDVRVKLGRMNDLITHQGGLIEQQGRAIEAQGRAIADQGRAIEAQGNQITEQGNQITEQGNRITEQTLAIQQLGEKMAGFGIQALADKVNKMFELVIKHFEPNQPAQPVTPQPKPDDPENEDHGDDKNRPIDSQRR